MIVETYGRVRRGVRRDEPEGKAEEDVIGVDEIGAVEVRLVVTEETVIIAVGRHERFEFRWDGWEEVAAKGDIGWDRRGSAAGRGAEANEWRWSVVRDRDGGCGGLM